MNVDDCLFCKMVAGEIPVTKIYEDDIVLSFLDIGPISEGHALVIPKQHYEKIHLCPPELMAQVALRIGKIAQAVMTAMKADGYNLLCNNGKAAGQVIDHLQETVDIGAGGRAGAVAVEIDRTGPTRRRQVP